MAQDVKKSPFKRVYFIGAGFSAGMQYPVGSTLMSRLLNYLQRGPESKELANLDFTNILLSKVARRDRARADRIAYIIQQVLKKYFATTNVDQVNVAEFFSIAHTLAQTPQLFGPSEIVRNTAASPESVEEPSEATLYDDLAAATRTYFTAIGEIEHLRDDIKSVLKRLKPTQDAVVNFNWDEELELALCNRRDINYTFEDWWHGRDFLVLKPHGSIGWYDVKQGIGNGSSYFIAGNDARIPRSKRRIMSYMDNALPKDINRKFHPPLSCPPVITPPTFAKRFEYMEQQYIWQDVLKVCGEAKEFIFLGYSLPKDDFLSRAAIRSALYSRPDSERNNLRCIVVGQSFDEANRINFQSVFPSLNEKNHFLKWRFGTGDSSLASLLEQKLEAAIL